MTELNRRDEQNRLATQRQQRNEDFFQRYIEEQGTEKAIGYLNALNDFMAEIDKILYLRHPAPQSSYHENSLAIIRRELKKFVEDKDKLLSSEVVENFCTENNMPQAKILPH